MRTPSGSFSLTRSHIPPLPRVASRRLVRPKGESLLPLAVADRETRPQNLLLSALSHVEPGQTAAVVAVVRGIDEKAKRGMLDRELHAVFGEDAPDGLDTSELLGPTTRALRWVFLGGGGRGAKGRAGKPAQRDRKSQVDSIRERAGGSARLDKADRKLFETSFYTVAAADAGVERTAEIASRLAAELASELAAALAPDRGVGHSGLKAQKVDPRAALVARAQHSAVLATADELAAVLSPPDSLCDTSGLTLASTAVPLLDAPPWMRQGSAAAPGWLRLGEAMPGTDRARVVQMSIDDLSGSAFLTGRAGSGKSVWLESILRDLSLSPQGATFAIDPNATLVRHSLMLAARDHPELLASGKVSAVDWSDPTSTPVWNPLACRDEAEVEIACFQTEVFITALNVGDLQQLVRALGYLRAAIRNLAEANLTIYRAARKRGDDPDAAELLTVLDLHRYFTDDTFRERCLAFANRDVATRFNELAELKAPERRVIFEALLHRLDTCANTPSVALLADCPRSKLWWGDQIEAGETVLHALDVLGASGAASAGVLPTLLAAYFRSAENVWVKRGRPTGDELRSITSVMVADEVQNLAGVASDELQRALAMLRKVGVRLIGACQYQKQMTDAGGAALGDAIRLNVAHRLSFLVPATEGKGLDASALDRERGIITGQTLANLPRFHLIASLDLTRPDGQPEQTDPFVLHSIDPHHPVPGDADYESIMDAVESVYARGRERFCRPRAVAEQERNLHPQRIVEELTRAAGGGTGGSGSNDSGRHAPAMLYGERPWGSAPTLGDDDVGSIEIDLR